MRHDDRAFGLDTNHRLEIALHHNHLDLGGLKLSPADGDRISSEDQFLRVGSLSANDEGNANDKDHRNKHDEDELWNKYTFLPNPPRNLK